MKSPKRFLLRITPALYRDLEAWAQQELRSVNGQIEYLLKEAVATRRRSRSEETPGSAEDQDDAGTSPHLGD
ncbi:MAG: hypothetical protein A2V70_11455 [Planctomycetes bacterium RBG_13_63_9]|nr:MAG: hypothetical protein A2V70_11455 [Planctomycetes bacterium RBG_13_63_9]